MLDISLINVDVRSKRAENDEGGQRGNPDLSRSCKTKFEEAVAVRCSEEHGSWHNSLKTTVSAGRALDALLTRSYISYSAVIDREINSEADASSSKEPTALSATIIALRILAPVFLTVLREPFIAEFQTLQLQP